MNELAELHPHDPKAQPRGNDKFRNQPPWSVKRSKNPCRYPPVFPLYVTKQCCLFLSEGSIVTMIKTEDSVISPLPSQLSESKTTRPGISLQPDDDASVPELLIYPRSGWISIDWREMWAHRELLAFLIWRDVSVRYKQTVLGPAWAVFQPMIMMAIFSVIFGRFAKIDSLGFPYPVFVFPGLIPWRSFPRACHRQPSALSISRGC